MTAERSSLVARLRQALMTSAAPDGGWPYYAGKSSRIEATAWALLAIAETSTDAPATVAAFADPHVRLLTKLQQNDGLLADYPQAPPNLTANGLTALVLTHLAATREHPLVPRLVGRIVSLKGVSVDSTSGKQDNRLQAWPWIPDTFSWVEPTAWCVLALKNARARIGGAGASRIDEADRLLLNRSCAGGGWNFGNSSALDQDLHPYVRTTALALIALQDHRADPVVQRSLAYLVDARSTEVSAAALSLTAICLRIFERPAAEVGDVEERLAADIPRAERLGNLQSLAMALYALSADRHNLKAFRV